MTTEGQALDNNVEIDRRRWNLNDVVPDDFEIVGSCTPLTFAMQKAELGPGANAFDSIDGTNPHSASLDALLQSLVYTSEIMHLQVVDGTKTTASVGANAVYPCQMFLEVVLESDEYRATRSGGDTTHGYDIRRRVLLSSRLVKKTDFDDDGEEDRESDLAPPSRNPALNVKFMADCRHRNVREYRLWIFDMSPSKSFVANYVAVLKTAIAAYAAAANGGVAPPTITVASTSASDAGDGGGAVGVGGGSGGGGGGGGSGAPGGFGRQARKQRAGLAGGSELLEHARPSSLIRPYERWKLIGARDAYVNCAAVYIDEPGLLDNNVRRLCDASRSPVDNNDHPANLVRVFGAHNYFLRTHPHLDPAQTTLSNYMIPVAGNKHTLKWRFPFPNRVLQLPTSLHDVRAFRAKYLPDYQLQVVQPRILRDESTLHNFIVKRAAEMLAGKSVTTVSQADDGADTDDEIDLDDAAAGGGGGGGNANRRMVEIADNASFDAGTTPNSVALNVIADDSATQAERTLALCHFADTALGAMPANAPLLTLERLRVQARAIEARQNDVKTYDELRAMMKKAALANSDFASAAARENRATIDEQLHANRSRSSIRLLASHFRLGEMRLIGQIDEPVQRAVLYTVAQDKAFRDYETTCAQPMSNISEKGRTINAYRELAAAAGLDSFKAPLMLFDRQMSTFGHVMVSRMIAYDTLYCCYSAHREIFDLMISLFDAYRDEFNLHYNVLLYGPPGLSKSWALETMQASAIPGTFSLVSRKTAAANDISFDRNDEAEWFGEFPRQWLIDPAELAQKIGASNHARRMGNIAPSTDTEALDKFKDKTTACIVSVYEPRRLDNGDMTTRRRTSEQIMTYCGATNLYATQIAAAIVSRMVLREHVDYFRGDVTMGDKETARSNSTREVLALLDRDKAQFRLLQIIVYHVNKLISIGALADVTLTTFRIYLKIFTDTLQNDYAIPTPIRSLKKMEIAVRTLVIIEAVYRLYCMPNAPFLNKPFEIAQLKHIEPWLKDHSEVVLFVFGFMANQYIDPNREVVVRALREYIRPSLRDPRLFFARQPTTSLGAFTSGSRGAGFNGPFGGSVGNSSSTAWQAKPLAPPPPASTTMPMSNFLPPSAANLAVGRGNNLAAPAPPGSGVTKNPAGIEMVAADDSRFDFSRVMLRTDFTRLVQMLESIISRTESRRLSQQQIHSVLRALERQMYQAYPYVQNAHFGNASHEDGEWPVVVNNKVEKQVVNCVEVGEYQDRYVSVHCSVLFARVPDPIEAVIKKCIDAYMPRGKYVTGETHRANTPHLFGVRHVAPNHEVHHLHRALSNLLPSERAIVASDAMCAEDAERELDGPAPTGDLSEDSAVQSVAQYYQAPWNDTMPILLKCSVDELSTRARLYQIHLPATPELVLFYTPFSADAAMRATPGALRRADQLIDYPESMMRDVGTARTLKSMREIVAGHSLRDASTMLSGDVRPITSLMNVQHRANYNVSNELGMQRTGLKEADRVARMLLDEAHRGEQAREQRLTGAARYLAEQERVAAEERAKRMAVVETTLLSLTKNRLVKERNGSNEGSKNVDEATFQHLRARAAADLAKRGLSASEGSDASTTMQMQQKRLHQSTSSTLETPSLSEFADSVDDDEDWPAGTAAVD